METFALPITNGVLPRADGGVMQGLFLDPYFSKMLVRAGVGSEIFLFPISVEDRDFYPVGVLARIEDLWTQQVIPEKNIVGLFARVSGRERCRAGGFEFQDEGLVACGVERVDFRELRVLGYPVICGAGWRPTGGYTTFGSDKKSIEITIYGWEYETGRDVAIVGRLSGQVEPEQAHTIEHAIIRSLKNYAICTPKTLRECMKRETEELKWSVEVGIAHKLPEVFGVTRSGVCGNPMTQMASMYLTEELKKQLKKGLDIFESLSEARRKTVSRLTQDMDISTERGLRALQGLKKGMFHDDSPGEMKKLKDILKRFPQDPWH
ncbi:hypothetical protein [Thermosediminibacter litoriperuensis]|uniref:Uncharacterized protein n=1 Tax=Thermosediminibacter litoriperuensis TaxID=291989 RepID=A0A5S5AZQ6_9FIRM|nr:hypothetical protein [Thermosediminibacter litoriperuensis]TYP58745.1 hypothetical protein LZ11_00200 [Thermosediminibacter litoriperuensis]